jgi:hypothetical protein
MNDQMPGAPINTGLAESIRRKAETEKARLRSLMPSSASTIVDINEAKAVAKPLQLNEVPGNNVFDPENPQQKNSGLADRNLKQINEEKKRLKAIMPSASLVENNPLLTTLGKNDEHELKSTIPVDTHLTNCYPQRGNSLVPAPLAFEIVPGTNYSRPFVYEDVEKEFGKLIDFDVENKNTIKETASNEGKQKTIKATELNTMLYAVQKELRESEKPELEAFANALSEEIVQTIISGAKTYNYDKYCGFVKTFTKLTEDK